MKGPDFIGLGAQKSGSSWIYACLHDHPEICIPRKEIHFFSRERNWLKGYDWYIRNFSSCNEEKKSGEFSTSYLYDEQTPLRIYKNFSDIKLIISLRNPIDRAFSNYINDVKTGAVPRNVKFLDALVDHPEYINQGYYSTQINRYLTYFDRKQILLLIYEDSIRDPQEFIKKIYKFIGVTDSFASSYLNRRINIARIPKYLWIDRLLREISFSMRKHGFYNLFWYIKKFAIADSIRSLNTRSDSDDSKRIDDDTRKFIYEHYEIENEVSEISKLIGRDLEEWRV